MIKKNFYALIEQHYKANPKLQCLVTEAGLSLDRAWLHDLTGRYANVLVGLGCAVGDRVAVQVDKSPQALALYYACIRAGLCFMPLNTAYKDAERTHLLEDGSPTIFISQQEGRPAGLPCSSIVMTFRAAGGGSLDELASRASSEFSTVAVIGSAPACLIYTSGTTGKPKGVIISHCAMIYSAETLKDVWEITPSDVLLHALPLFHAHGLMISSNVLLAVGGQMQLLSKFDVDLFVEHVPACSVFMGVPTLFHRLLADGRIDADLCQHMRLFTCGSAPLSPDLHKAFEERTGHAIVERYGATETLILCSNPLHGRHLAGSVGLPLPGVDLRIASAQDNSLPQGEVGMIQVRGEGLFSGYWRMPELTQKEYSADGWFRTGDLGVISPAGYVTITGRSKDLVISGGYNVYPSEVENALNEMAAVRESAIVGTPDVDFGEAVVAFVIAADSDAPPTAAEVIGWAKQRLANYKVPKQVHVVDEFPRNAMGKVMKNQLRERLATIQRDV
jgi:malonyl-CoA/methylmalonyl-CoA synthetase